MAEVEYGPEYVLSFLGLADSWPPGAWSWRLLCLPSFHAEFVVEVVADHGPPTVSVVTPGTSLWYAGLHRSDRAAGRALGPAQPEPMRREHREFFTGSEVSRLDGIDFPEGPAPQAGMDGARVRLDKVEANGIRRSFECWNPTRATCPSANALTQGLLWLATTYVGDHSALWPFRISEIAPYFRDF